MSEVEHRRLSAVFGEVSELPDGPARAQRLTELCAGDAALRSRVEELLRFDAGDDATADPLAPGALLRSDLEALWDQQGTPLVDAEATAPARYEIQRLLGEGGFGSVYLALEEEPIPRQVAIKVLKPGMDSRQVLERFDIERRTLALMDHPGIARVYAAGVDTRGRPYFAMEYVDGPPITEFCDARRSSLRERLELFVLVCQTIQYAHYKGIVHRDVKPANVLVTLVDGKPVPKVIDFGIAKAVSGDGERSVELTRAGQLVGTPVAMSPEQARGDVEVDTRADVYALGGLAYELLCGAPPFTDEGDTTDLHELRRRILQVDPPRPSLRVQGHAATAERVASLRGLSARALVRELATDLDWIVMRALEKDRERRYPTASDLALDVQRALADEPVSACPPSRSYQLSKFVRRNRAVLAAASVMLVLLVGGIIGSTIGWLRSERALEVARDESRHARAISDFLNEDLLGAVSPESLGHDVSMRRVLDVAASQVDGRFTDRPRTERAIRLTLGRTYRALAQHDHADVQLAAALATLPPAGELASDSDMPGIQTATGGQRESSAADRARIALELGRLRLQENRNAEAETILRAAWEACPGTLHNTGDLCLDTLHFLGVSLAEQQRFDEARQAFDAVRAAVLATPGEQSELAVRALHSQAFLALDEAHADGGPVDASIVQIFERTHADSRSLHGADDPRTIRRLIDLAVALEQSGSDSARAIGLLEEAHTRSLGTQGAEHPTTAVAALSLGALELRSGSTELAAPRFEAALASATPLGGAHPVLQRARFELAVCRMYQERFDDAVELAETAFHAEGTPTPDAELTPTQQACASFLAEACSAAGRVDAAAQWAALTGGH
ncbi:MAG: hypothetical protein DHS20C15_28030 [Planctomycetota bacterium]|nr:MAG: hypothetical protein DHS20C15_28030 [Planctomycetota bacterium]